MDPLAAYWIFGIAFIGVAVWYHRDAYRAFLNRPWGLPLHDVLLVFAVALMFASLIWPALVFATFVDEEQP